MSDINLTISSDKPEKPGIKSGDDVSDLMKTRAEDEIQSGDDVTHLFRPQSPTDASTLGEKFDKLSNFIFRPPEFVTNAARNISNWMTTPTAPTGNDLVDQIRAQSKGFLGGATEGLASLLSPANVAMTAFDLPPAASRAIGGAQMLTGGRDISKGDYLSGIANLGFGALGVKKPSAGIPQVEGEAVPNITPEPTPTPAPIRKPIALLPESPRFIAGEAGIAENRPYNIDTGPITPSLNPRSAGTILPQEYGEINQIPPDLAARRGLAIGRPMNNVDVVADLYNRPMPETPVKGKAGWSITGKSKLDPNDPFAGSISKDEVIDSHGTANQYNQKDYNMQFSGGDRQYAASRARGKAMREWAKKKGEEEAKSKENPLSDDDITEMHGGLGIPGLKVDKEKIKQVVNLPKAYMSSLDLSAPLRQGLPMIHRKEYWSAFGKMFGMAKNQETYDNVMEQILTRPNYELGQQSGLSLTNTLTHGEEAFANAQMAEKGTFLPAGQIRKLYGATVGKAVETSERAYVGFINKLRSDTFDTLIKNAQDAGYPLSENNVPTKLSKDIAKYVNTATGRGDLGNLNKISEELNLVLFSPRMIASRVQMLNPSYYVKLEPQVRQEALKSLLSVAGFGVALNSLGALAGAKLSSNILSSDFGKVRIGNQGDTRLDPYAGFQQYVVAAARLITGQDDKHISTGPFAFTRMNELERFGSNKLSPVARFIYDWMSTKKDTKGNTVDRYGQSYNINTKLEQMLIPLVLQDIYDIYKSDPSILPLGILPVLGMGTQTYHAQPKTKMRFNKHL